MNLYYFYLCTISEVVCILLVLFIFLILETSKPVIMLTDICSNWIIDAWINQKLWMIWNWNLNNSKFIQYISTNCNVCNEPHWHSKVVNTISKWALCVPKKLFLNSNFGCLNVHATCSFQSFLELQMAIIRLFVYCLSQDI